MSVISITVTPPGGSPLDITDDCVFERCSFESQFNGAPGSFDILVRDPDQTHFFATGYEIQCTIDGSTQLGGYVTVVGLTSFAPAAPIPGTPEDYEMRAWHLTGVDYNIALDRRVFRNPADYLKIITVNEVVDGAILRAAIDGYTDMDDFDTSGIDDVATIPDITFVSIQQGWAVRKEFEVLLPFSGAVYYIDGDKTIVWKAYDNVEKRWGFSDVPNNAPITSSPDEYQGATYGFSQVEGTEDGTMLANDVLIWGGSEWAGSGGTVFARATDTDSIDDKGLWQHAETHFGETMFKSQRGVNAVANAILSGPPGTDLLGQQKGLKAAQWQFTFTWNSSVVPLLDGVRDHIRAGDLVTVNLSVFDVTRLLPVRSLRISFPDALEEDGTHLVVFNGTFGLQLSDSFTLWRYVIKNQNRVIVQTQAIAPAAPTPTNPTTTFGSSYVGTTGKSPAEVVPNPDGSTTTFTIPFGYISDTSQVFLNGLRQSKGTDYFESNNQAGEITFSSAPLATDTITIAAFTIGGTSTTTVPGGAYYLSTAGSDSTGDGSEGNPWATLDKFFSLPPGPDATVVMRGGTYTGSLNHNISWASYASSAGTAGHPVTIRSFPGEFVTIDGGANGTSDDNVFWLIATGALSHVVINGIILRNFSMTQDGIVTLSNQDDGGSITDWSFINCDIQQVAPADPSAQMVYLGERFTNGLFSNCTFRGPYPSGSVTGGAAISLYADSGPSPTNVTIDHCIFLNCYNAVQFYDSGSSGSVTHNTFRGSGTNIDLTHHAVILVQNNAGENGDSANIYDPDPTGTTANHNFWAQTFSAANFLLPGNTGIKAATDGTDAGALNT